MVVPCCGAGVFKVFCIRHFLHQVLLILSPTSKCSLHRMRFTLNAFILSTVALLSLITPLVHADGDAVTVTNPVAGETLNAFESVDVTWYVAKRDNPSAVCHHMSLTADIIAGPSTTTPWEMLTAS